MKRFSLSAAAARNLSTRPERLRAFVVAAHLVWAAACLLVPHFMRALPYSGMDWLPQPVWGVVALVAAVWLACSAPGVARACAGGFAAFVWLAVSASFIWSVVYGTVPATNVATGIPIYLLFSGATLTVVMDGAR